MKKVFLSYLFCSIFISSHFCFGQTNRLKISSPDKTTLCEFTIDKNGSLKYRVYYQNKPVIIWSSLGLVVNKTHLGENTVINDVSQRKYNETFPWPLGENDVIANRFREIKLACKSSSIPFNIIARVFDGSVAFRYEVLLNGEENSFMINKENTAFNFSSSFTLYQYNQESVFTPTSIDTFRKTSDLPTTVVTSDPSYISIGEAENLTYTKAELIR